MANHSTAPFEVPLHLVRLRSTLLSNHRNESQIQSAPTMYMYIPDKAFKEWLTSYNLSDDYNKNCILVNLSEESLYHQYFASPYLYVPALPQLENWCTITYHECERKVGEIFMVSEVPNAIVHGGKDLFGGNYFALGDLKNKCRTAQAKHIRQHIGDGVQLYLDAEEGEIWLKCLSAYPVFVQSFYLDNFNQRILGTVVHQIHPTACVKVFSLRTFYHTMMSAMHYYTSVVKHMPRRIIYTLWNYCTLRLSFTEGFGPDYPLKSVVNTSCWVEVNFTNPQQLLSEELKKVLEKPGKRIE